MRAATVAAGGQANATWDKLTERDVIVVGVKADTRIWGFRFENGNIVRMQVDMAQLVTDALGVDIELVAADFSNRRQKPQSGCIDLMIATMFDRTDRREQGAFYSQIVEERHGTFRRFMSGMHDNWHQPGGLSPLESCTFLSIYSIR